MAATVRPGDQVVFVGDSITAAAWMSVTGGLVDQINAQIPVVNMPRVATVAGGAAIATLAPGARAATVAAVSTQSVIRVVNSGVPGNKAADIAADVAGRITNYNPNVVVMLIGVNDAVNVTSLASFQTSIHTILSTTRAALPSCKIVVLSILWWSEQWAAGPVWNNFYDPPPSNPTYTPSIAEYNAILQSECAAVSGTYIDTRAPALAYEAANNTPAPGAVQGILTQDRIHPTIPLGQVQIGNWCIGSFTVTS